MKKYSVQLIAVFCLAFFAACGSNNEIDTNLFPAKDSEGKLCYIDSKGKKIIELEGHITEASIFHGDRAKVQDYNRLYGFIDKKGNVVIELKYKDATYFSDGLAWVVETDGYPIAIDKEGNTVIDMPQIRKVLPFNDGLAVCDLTDGGYGMIDKSGKMTISTEYSELRSYSQGLISFQKGYKLWGYMDNNQNVKIEAQFKDAESFLENGYAIVTDEDGKKGVINTKGEYVIKPQFREIFPDGDLFLVNSNIKFGWMDKNEKYIINPQYEYALPFGKSNLASVSISAGKGAMVGFIDKKGKEVIAPQFEFASSFVNDVAIVVIGNKCGFINKKGEIVVNPAYNKIDIPTNYHKLRSADNNENIYTDYLDYESIINNLLGKFDARSFREFDGKTTAKEVKAKFDTKISTRGTRAYITYPRESISPGLSLTQQIFSFNDSPTQNENARLTSVQAKFELVSQTSKIETLTNKINEAVGGEGFDRYELDVGRATYALDNEYMTALAHYGRNNVITIDINFK